PHDAAGAGDVAHGSTEIPPAPAVREISPAPGEYREPWPGGLLFWPVAWAAVAILFFLAARAWTGPVKQGHGEEGETHEAAADDRDDLAHVGEQSGDAVGRHVLHGLDGDGRSEVAFVLAAARAGGERHPELRPGRDGPLGFGGEADRAAVALAAPCAEGDRVV